ncbi:hypothetical protein BN7_6423 [Wickerhamomyces ciferrii]|uniref:Uncharacterized protein n=1 Tax=Wickerhamomyces ciferrii (strain ATCC 14091 / BCRC 22168 / CBS 111 / JCM 3599 / NBRC 0793 / NRRL Y-1031 F-60-10) TaxID=1206466 RepID=K0KZR5_WICCF|nr:uncharacterized protein BN7_6423 [Wickerhamomyces ciferrii]CCH46824.1 hypothetical protein BN7_6423 [Wickerhamomyces ciferrii]
MDYNIKQENRKKFQDKSKLKRHHKKDYSKVIPKESTDQNKEEPQQIEETEIEYEDVLDPETDEQGRFVLHGDQYEAINDEGVTVVRRPKIDKTKTNAWRYRDELEILGLDQDDEELLKNIDFKKLNFNKIDSKKDKSSFKDFKKMSNDELRNLKIIDSKFDDPDSTYDKSEDDIDDLERLLSKRSNKSTIKSQQIPHDLSNPSFQSQSQSQPSEKNQNKTPVALKSDEAFLDDLL